jgi:hypothetical protein
MRLQFGNICFAPRSSPFTRVRFGHGFIRFRHHNLHLPNNQVSFVVRNAIIPADIQVIICLGVIVKERPYWSAILGDEVRVSMHPIWEFFFVDLPPSPNSRTSDCSR